MPQFVAIYILLLIGNISTILQVFDHSQRGPDVPPAHAAVSQVQAKPEMLLLLLLRPYAVSQLRISGYGLFLIKFLLLSGEPFPLRSCGCNYGGALGLVDDYK